MRYSLLMVFGVAALGLAPRSGYALESCYQICNPNVSCSTPCIDPYRPYTGPLACGAGFSCKRSRQDISNNKGGRLRSNNDAFLFSEFNIDQAVCKSDPRESRLLAAPSSRQEHRGR